jgi:tRNA threonylcarbamoyladenosine biosynthesis protein TsaE
VLLPDEPATAALGAAVERALRPGEAVCLYGPLGAGKTSFARGLIRAATSPQEEVPSPTFTLVQLYVGERLTISHLDLYRLSDPDEAFELGLDEALEVGAAVIEWPERLGLALPPDRLAVEIEHADPGRRARLTGHGAWRSRVAELAL